MCVYFVYFNIHIICNDPIIQLIKAYTY